MATLFLHQSVAHPEAFPQHRVLKTVDTASFLSILEQNPVVNVRFNASRKALLKVLKAALKPDLQIEDTELSDRMGEILEGTALSGLEIRDVTPSQEPQVEDTVLIGIGNNGSTQLGVLEPSQSHRMKAIAPLQG